EPAAIDHAQPGGKPGLNIMDECHVLAPATGRNRSKNDAEDRWTKRENHFLPPHPSPQDRQGAEEQKMPLAENPSQRARSLGNPITQPLDGNAVDGFVRVATDWTGGKDLWCWVVRKAGQDRDRPPVLSDPFRDI